MFRLKSIYVYFEIDDIKSADIEQLFNQSPYEEIEEYILNYSDENYEKEIGKKFAEAAKDSRVQAKIEELTSGGMDKGYATLKALEEIYPSDKLDGIRKSTEGWQSLSRMARPWTPTGRR